jgi:hypothetical protein
VGILPAGKRKLSERYLAEASSGFVGPFKEIQSKIKQAQ